MVNNIPTPENVSLLTLQIVQRTHRNCLMPIIVSHLTTQKPFPVNVRKDY